MADLATPARATAGCTELDLGRSTRRRYPEAVLCEHKTPAQLAFIALALKDAHDHGTTTGAALFTRAPAAQAEAVLGVLPDAIHDEVGRILASPPRAPEPTGGLVAVLCAGTSDLPVAREALVTLNYLGRPTAFVVDIGVGGIHRVLAGRTWIRSARGHRRGRRDGRGARIGRRGLASAPVVAFRRSVGRRGVRGAGSRCCRCSTPLFPGVGVVNIDNGYGAGHLAAQIAPTRADGSDGSVRRGQL